MSLKFVEMLKIRILTRLEFCFLLVHAFFQMCLTGTKITRSASFTLGALLPDAWQAFRLSRTGATSELRKHALLCLFSFSEHRLQITLFPAIRSVQKVQRVDLVPSVVCKCRRASHLQDKRFAE